MSETFDYSQVTPFQQRIASAIAGPERHTPSPFFNRGPGGNENPFNYGRMEYDILHHVSSAVHAFAAELDWDLAFGHINAARRRLDALEALIRSSKASCRSVERSGHTTTPGV